MPIPINEEHIRKAVMAAKPEVRTEICTAITSLFAAAYPDVSTHEELSELTKLTEAAHNVWDEVLKDTRSL